MSNFNALKAKVQSRFEQLVSEYENQAGEYVKDTLLVVATDPEELFNAYLAAMPEDERQSHNCNCCRSFLKNYGNIVVIRDGEVLTMWDFSIDAEPYQHVPAALRDLVLSKPLESSFLSEFEKLGTDSNTQRLENGEVIRWQHLFVKLPRDRVYKNKEVSIASVLGEESSTRQVFKRGLKEITADAIETVVDLINEGNLYKGDEFLGAVKRFLKFKTEYDSLKKNKARELFVWDNFKEGGRIRNSSIGKLLVALSEDEPLEDAVKSFEAKVAPANWKRPTAIATPKMVQAAQKKIAALGYDASLLRRHATPDDIPVSNLLYVNRNRKKLTVFDEVSKGAPVNPKSFYRAQELELAEFLDSLKTATSLEILVPNDNNFVSLIAAADPEAPSMFSWDNSVSWTYQNNLTDVIREKVKAAGGAVEGELRVSLEWFNFDDLDLHVIEPNGNKIYFRSPRSGVSGGELDVDMNAGFGRTREAVENIIFTDSHRMLEGKYTVVVNNFNKRENIDFGFNLQIECQSSVIDLSSKKALPDGNSVTAATFNYHRATGLSNFKSELDEAYSSREVNGVFTNTFHSVSMVMYSPNHWNDKVGHKHLFFILPEAHQDIPLRPFANEFLCKELSEHRKVLEVLSSKLMVKPADQQVTGIGYSTTQRNQVVVRIDGNRVVKVSI